MHKTTAALCAGALGALLAVSQGSTAADGGYVPPLTATPLPESEQEAMWDAFAQDVGFTSEEIAAYRAGLPQAGIDDLMWIRQAQHFNKLLLEMHRPLSADDLLVAKPDVQLTVKLMADILYGSATAAHPATAFDDALWDHFANELADFAPLRDGDQEFTAADALWTRIAQDYDTATLRHSPVTAYELLDMPDYLLHRKLIVDSVVASMLDCARCGISPTVAACKEKQRCQRDHETRTELCKGFTEACGTNRLARLACDLAYQQCECVSDWRCELCGGGPGYPVGSASTCLRARAR